MAKVKVVSPVRVHPCVERRLDLFDITYPRSPGPKVGPDPASIVRVPDIES